MCLIGGLFLTGAATRADADAWNKKTYVTISKSIEVPGAVLPPGKYVFKLLDSSSNRHIVQIMNAEENHVYTTNLAISKERMEPADKTIITFYEMPGGGPEPIRSWFYPGDTIGQEFAYPSQRASEIAQAMNQTVPVLAEARTPAAAPAAPVETPAPAPAPAPAAAAEPTSAQSGGADRSVAEEEAAPPPPPSPEAPPEAAPEEQPVQEPAAQQPSTPTDSTPAEPKMPQTAGDTAAIGLIGLACLGIAVSLRMAARRAGSKS